MNILLTKLCALVSLLALATSAAAQSPAPAPAPEAVLSNPANPSAKWEKEIAAFEQRDQAAPPPKGAILFVGSSSIRMWRDVAKDFPEHRVINRGFGGSMIADSVAFAERIVIPYEPRIIVFYAGGNDINAGKSPEVVAADFRAFAEKVHARLPETEIAFISIAPNPSRWLQIEKVRKANSLVEEYTRTNPRLKYIDVHSRMLGEDGLPKEGIFLEDKLHMNAEGYKIWTEVLKAHLPPPDRTPEETR